MKKTIISFISIILILFVVFTLLDLHGEYPAERALWRINNKFAQVVKDPKIVPEKVFDNLVNEYENFTKKYSKSPQVSLAHILTGRVYLTKQDYKSARKKYEEIAQLYKDEPNLAVQAVADIGRSYALENNFDAVIRNYKRAIKDYPLTDIGLRSPVLMAQYFAENKKINESMNAFQEARTHYETLIKNNPDSMIEFDAMRLLATTYLAQNQKKKALEILGKVLLKFPQGKYLTAQRINTLLKSINTISVIDLNDYDYAINLYDEFMNKYKNHPLNPVLKQMNSSLKYLKNKKVDLELKNETKKK